MVLWWPTRSSKTNTKKRCTFHHQEDISFVLLCFDFIAESSSSLWIYFLSCECMFLGSLSRHNKDLEQRTLKPSACHPQDGQYQNQTDYILCSQRWKSSIQSAKTRLGADRGSDHQLLIAKFRLKLKNVRKTTRPFMYDLNQIPFDFTVDVMTRFKGLELVECLKNYGQRFITLYRRWCPKTISKKKKCKKAKWFCEKALQIAEKRRELRAKEKGKEITNWMQRFGKQQGEIRKAS